jgi:hypothetical protein
MAMRLRLAGLEHRTRRGTGTLLSWPRPSWPQVAVVAICVALLAIDRLPRFYQGDSTAYLATGLSGWVPPDRSWAYGFGARWLVEAAHSVGVLVALQALAMAGALLMLCRDMAGFPRARAATMLFAVVASLDPLNVAYSRFWLTDTLSAAAFLAFVVLAARSVAQRRLRHYLPFLVVAVVVSVFIRVAYVPIELGTIAIASVAMLARRMERPAGTMRRLVVLAALPILAGSGLALANARVAMPVLRGHVSLNHDSGLYTMGVFLPGLRYADFQAAGVDISPAEFAALHLEDYRGRSGQMWSDGPHFIRSLLETKLGVTANYDPRLQAVCAAVVRSALLHHPQTLVAVYLGSLALYFDPQDWSAGFAGEMGFGRPLPDWTANFLGGVTGHAVPTNITARRTLLTDVLGATLAFYPALLLAGAAAAAYVLWRRAAFGTPHLLSSALLASLLATPLYSHAIIPRYLLATVTLSECLVCLAVFGALRSNASVAIGQFQDGRIGAAHG